jgi:4-hydroxybenzoate polyprenyltransferase
VDTTSRSFPPLWAYLQLMRPANVITAWADIFVGYAASGLVVNLDRAIAQPTTFASLAPLAWLLLSTTGLYGGGVVFNDVFDAQLDARERPERPIPSGRASRQGAIWLGSTLLGVGVIAASQVSVLSAALATSVALAALLYDAIGKHNSVFGPLNMGLCRGGNLLLGVSAMPAIVPQRWFLLLIPLAYIAAVTAISQGEVHGGKKGTGVLALLLVTAVMSGVLALGFLSDYQLLAALPFLALLAGRIFPPFVNAVRSPHPEPIRAAVKAGVLSLIVLDASMAAGFASWTYGLLVLSLLPISTVLARRFAVT